MLVSDNDVVQRRKGERRRRRAVGVGAADQGDPGELRHPLLLGPPRPPGLLLPGPAPGGFFRSRVASCGGSTVLRLNVPPGPFLARDPRVVAVLDARSFRVLLDSSLVDKTDTLTGTYLPSLSLYGGFRPSPTSTPPTPSTPPSSPSSPPSSPPAIHLRRAARGQAGARARPDGHAKALKWLFFQLHPLVGNVAGALLRPAEDLLLHTFHLPPALVRADYDALARFFSDAGAAFMDDAERAGVARDEALHNLIFAAIFNAFGGLKIFFPVIMKWLAESGRELHARLAEEVRAEAGGEVTPAALERMNLVKSVVWECLRMDPPVPYQYGRARKDLVVESHDAAYKVKKGEMIFGYQPFATRDERVFENGSEFVADRFVGKEGRRLLEYVVWSNGAETAEAGAGNKQCPGKDVVVMAGRLFVVELFLRYDTFAADVGTLPLEPRSRSPH
uniref:Uncharacterized protein n=1 Tax=Ananas comosus var. bracteatus TaxID=296719 RepID=A0A6V7NU81_ANACO|nr:unnamed protein product [Ananas comosus var. bracteatus]